MSAFNNPLTGRQYLALAIICESIRVRGMPPTLREIGTRMAIRSTNGVNDHLRALERKGYLNREDMLSRALHPTEKGLAAYGLNGSPGAAPVQQLPAIPCITCGRCP